MKYILGSMSFTLDNKSSNLDNNDIQDIINYYRSNISIPQLDTARYYDNEDILGKLDLHNYLIDTKANPWYNNDFENGILGQLSRENITNQLDMSLDKLKIDKCNIFYLHCPDYETDIKETLKTCDELYRKEKFNHLGVSNFSKAQLKEILDICEKNNYITPEYYQGMLNPLCRKVDEIRPLLKLYNIKFYAYNPLAGGLLTGKYDTDDPNKFNSRFSNNSIYQNIFWKKEIINVINKLKKDNNIYELTWSWMKYHSDLECDDAIILGGTTLNQWKQNIETLDSCKPLSAFTLNKLNNLYLEINDITPNYYY